MPEKNICPRCKTVPRNGKEFGHFQRHCLVTGKNERGPHFCCTYGTHIDCQIHQSRTEET
jgi:hypothetical protein